MEKNSTLNELAEFALNEKKMLVSLGLISPGSPQAPKCLVDNILNYSKVLRVYKTKNVGYLEFILN